MYAVSLNNKPSFGSFVVHYIFSYCTINVAHRTSVDRKLFTNIYIYIYLYIYVPTDAGDNITSHHLRWGHWWFWAPLEPPLGGGDNSNTICYVLTSPLMHMHKPLIIVNGIADWALSKTGRA